MSYSVAPVSPVAKKLIIVTVAIWFVVQIICGRFLGLTQWTYLVLTPEQVLQKFYIWQLATYMFFHSTSSPLHIIFNMLMLWFFGSELERRWGSKFFLFYYLGSGIGAAIIYCVGAGIYAAATGFRPIMQTPVIGASGALFGLLLAYGIIFSEREIYFIGFFPMKAKYFVILAGAMDFASLLGTGMAGGDVAYLAHLGGILSGFLILRGHVQYKSYQARTKLKRKSSNLRLVVDNDKSTKSDNPKYWN